MRSNYYKPWVTAAWKIEMKYLAKQYTHTHACVHIHGTHNTWLVLGWVTTKEDRLLVRFNRQTLTYWVSTNVYNNNIMWYKLLVRTVRQCSFQLLEDCIVCLFLLAIIGILFSLLQSLHDITQRLTVIELTVEDVIPSRHGEHHAVDEVISGRHGEPHAVVSSHADNRLLDLGQN